MKRVGWFILIIALFLTIIRLAGCGGYGGGGGGSGGERPVYVSSKIYATTIQADGKIVTAGYSYRPSAWYVLALARYNINGSLDTNFGSGGRVIGDSARGMGTAYAVAIQADGKIVVAGYGFFLARYNTNGSLDTSFGTNGMVTTDFGSGLSSAYAIAIQRDGKIVAVGGRWNFDLARYNTNGSLDASFGTGGKVTTTFGTNSDTAHAVAIQPNGEIVVAGRTYDYTYYVPWSALVRYNANGSLDTGFGSGGKMTTLLDAAYAVAIQTDSKIVTAGIDDGDFALTRHNSDGSLDGTFGIGGTVTTHFGSGGAGAYALAIQTDSKVVAVGCSYSDNGYSDFALARYTTDGGLDVGFGSNGKVTTPLGLGYDEARSAAVQSNGKIVATGAGGSDFGLARYNTDGSLDTSFGTGGTVTTRFY